MAAELVLSEAIHAALRADEDRPRMGFYRPSLLPSCLRRQFLIYKRGVIVPEEKMGLFKIGEMFHEFLDRTLRAGGLTVRAVEAPFVIVHFCGDEPIRVEGRADLILSVDGEEYVVEVKSVRKLPKEPFKHHVQQLNIYLGAYGIKRGFLIYLEKQALAHRIFPVEFSLEAFKLLLDRAAGLHQALISDSPPKPDNEEWECRYCEFRGECDSMIRGGFPQTHEKTRREDGEK
jgi:CRISPR/Cas system-associated exonuclease Cas4 (RecB family)